MNAERNDQLLMKRWLCAFLTVCLCFGFCGCGKRTLSSQPAQSVTEPVSQTQALKSAAVDAENYLKQAGVQISGMDRLTEGVDPDVYGSARAGSNVWILGNRKDDGRRVLVKLDHIAGNHVTMELTVPESDAARIADPPEGERLAVLYSLISTDAALPLLLRTVIHLEDSDEVYRQLYYDFELCTVTADGVVGEGVSLPVETLGDYLSLGCMDQEGIWFLSQKWSDNGEYLLTPQLRGYDPATGELLPTVALPEMWYGTSLRPLGEGDFAMIGIAHRDETGWRHNEDVRLMIVRDADGSAKTEEPARLPDEISNLTTFFLPAGDGQPVYLADGWGLWQWDVAENRYTLLHRWKDAGFEPRFDWLYALENGVFCHVGAVDVGEDRTVELWTLGGDAAAPAVI